MPRLPESCSTPSHHKHSQVNTHEAKGSRETQSLLTTECVVVEHTSVHVLHRLHAIQQRPESEEPPQHKELHPQPEDGAQAQDASVHGPREHSKDKRCVDGKHRANVHHELKEEGTGEPAKAVLDDLTP